MTPYRIAVSRGESKSNVSLRWGILANSQNESVNNRLVPQVFVAIVTENPDDSSRLKPIVRTYRVHESRSLHLDLHTEMVEQAQHNGRKAKLAERSQ